MGFDVDFMPGLSNEMEQLSILHSSYSEADEQLQDCKLISLLIYLS